jgi:hypothetical protein
VPGTAPSKTGVVGGIYNSSAPSPTTGQTLPVQLDSSGNLKVNVAAGSSGNAAASATGSAVPADAGYTGFNSGGNLVGVSTSNPLPAQDVTDGTPGSTPPTLAQQIAGTDGTDLRAVLTNLEGSLLTNPASTIGSNFLGTTTGTDCIWTVPSGKRWRIISLACLFQPDATVANRGIGVIWQDASGHTAGIAGYSVVVTASAPTFISAASGVVPQNNTFDALPNINLALPENLILGPGMVIRTYSTGLDASDKFSGPTLLYEQWSDT